MSNAILAVCKWLESTSWASFVRLSLWVYPYVQLVHFSGLSLWIGTSVAVDLRLLGIGRRRQTAAQLSRDLLVWNWLGFGIALTGGFLLFASIASTYFYNAAFRVKLLLLVPAGLLWHILVQRKARTWGRSAETPAVGKLAALIELLLWISVVTAAVLIPSY